MHALMLPSSLGNQMIRKLFITWLE